MHFINGRRRPDGGDVQVTEGQVVRMHIVNKTGEWHTMHIHGHEFTVLAVDGRPIQGSPIHLDTIPVGPNQVWDVAFLADNPGLWMFHCHVLLHARMGMSAMIVYRGIQTPYNMGSRSGQRPGVGAVVGMATLADV